MITGILILAPIMAIAFAWLLYETKFLTVRMESYEYQKSKALQSISRGIKPNLNSRIPYDDEDVEPYSPTEFMPLDMPELTGTLNIICERG